MEAANNKPSDERAKEEVVWNTHKYSVFGKMRVKEDGSVVAVDRENIAEGHPNDPSCKHFFVLLRLLACT